MNIAEILQRAVDKLNDDSKCGLCWRFVLAGRQDYLNLAKMPCDGDCCVLVGVMKAVYKTGYQTSTSGNLRTHRDWEIEIFAGIQSRLDIQFFNEVDPDLSDESKWSKYLYPISCCFDESEIDFCGLHSCINGETTIEITSWNAEMKINYMDNNYDGWLYRATFREWLQ